MVKQYAPSEIADQLEADEEVAPTLSPEDKDFLRENNPHLYDLCRIRDKLRSQIMALEKEFAESPSSRLVYPLCNLYSKYLEVMAEIRALEEQTQYAALMIDQVIAPMTSRIFQTFTDMLYLLNKTIGQEVGENSRVKEQFDRLAIEFGRFLDGSKEQAGVEINKLYGADK